MLDALADAAQPLTLSELARLVSLPKSTLHRLMRILVELRLAVQPNPKHYELGDYLPRLAAHCGPARVHDISCRITPFLLELFRSTRQVVSVATLTGAMVHHAGMLYDHNHTTLARSLRAPVPAYRSAAGKLLLANSIRPIASGGPHVVMRRELALIRRTGLSYARGEYLPELAEVAAPVCLGNANPVAAMVVAGPAGQMDLRAVGRILADVADSVEEGASRDRCVTRHLN